MTAGAIESGEIQYHGMDTVEATLSTEGTMPALTARPVTDATI